MTRWRLLRILRARPHLLAGAMLVVLTFLLLTPVRNTALRAVSAWDAGSLLFLVLTALSFLRNHDRDISADAKQQQEGEWSVFALTVLGAIASFAAIFLFSHASAAKHHTGDYLGFVVATLTLSWLTTHVSFAYRYAHEYYAYDLGGPEFDRGIAFPQDDKPDYLDFVYFSFVLGMTFQVSDCNVTSKKLRRLATLQGMIGFLFNTVILALSVNIAASLL
ncbi:MAG: hypothetical protein B7Z81_01610 [Acidocella sp. 20-61-6]|nr:MAG: hypothetical protein B7Z81_01610 [Acidocella sp. 20-61-6]